MRKLTLLSAACVAFPDLSRDAVYAAILCGEVFVNGEKSRDPRVLVPDSAEITHRAAQFVSRGGLKVDHALRHWQIDVGGMVMLDAGASTGGFTDCLLQRGAASVHAVDVGTNQLDYRLRSDPRVIVHERTNIMSVQSLIPEADAAVADLSFRSLRGVAAHILELTHEGWAILLVKPQFELRGHHADFHGVVRSDGLLASVLEEVTENLWQERAFVNNIIRSPILGRRGNREYLFLVRNFETIARTEILDLLKAAV